MVLLHLLKKYFRDKIYLSIPGIFGGKCKSASACSSYSTAVLEPRTEPYQGISSWCQQRNYECVLKVSDVLVETIKEEDAVPLIIHVMKERETVMDLVMEVVMMAMPGVKEILSVEAIIVRSLVCITMTKMIVVKKHLQRTKRRKQCSSKWILH